MTLALVFLIMYAIYRCLFLLRDKHDPQSALQRQESRYAKRAQKLLTAIPTVAAAASGPASGIVAGLSAVAANIKKAEALVTHRMELIAPPTDSPGFLDDSIRFFESHIVAFAIIGSWCAASTAIYSIYRLLRYRSNYCPALFPWCPASDVVKGHVKADLFLHISDLDSGTLLIAYLMPIGLPPSDLRFYGSITLGQIAPVYSCLRLRRLKIDWANYQVYNRDSTYRLPLPQTATVSVFTSTDFSKFTPERTTIHVVGRLLEHCFPLTPAHEPPPSLLQHPPPPGPGPVPV